MGTSLSGNAFDRIGKGYSPETPRKGSFDFNRLKICPLIELVYISRP